MVFSISLSHSLKMIMKNCLNENYKLLFQLETFHCWNVFSILESSRRKSFIWPVKESLLLSPNSTQLHKRVFLVRLSESLRREMILIIWNCLSLWRKQSNIFFSLFDSLSTAHHLLFVHFCCVVPWFFFLIIKRPHSHENCLRSKRSLMLIVSSDSLTHFLPHLLPKSRQQTEMMKMLSEYFWHIISLFILNLIAF